MPNRLFDRSSTEDRSLLTEVRVPSILIHAVQKVYANFPRLSSVPLVEHGLMVPQEGHLWACRMRLLWRQLVFFLFTIGNRA